MAVTASDPERVGISDRAFLRVAERPQVESENNNYYPILSGGPETQNWSLAQLGSYFLDMYDEHIKAK